MLLLEWRLVIVRHCPPKLATLLGNSASLGVCDSLVSKLCLEFLALAICVEPPEEGVLRPLGLLGRIGVNDLLLLPLLLL